jgi:hypothetical protein
LEIASDPSSQLHSMLKFLPVVWRKEGGEPLYQAIAKEWATITHALTTSTHPLAPTNKT